MRKPLLFCAFILGTLSLWGQDLSVDVTIECSECKILTGGPEGASTVKGSLSWSVTLAPGKSLMVMTMPQSVLKPVDMTITAVAKGNGFSVTTFAQGKDHAMLPVVNSIDAAR